MGARIPFVGVSKDKDLHVTSAISGNWNNVGNMKDYKLVENKWIKVDISQNLNDEKVCVVTQFLIRLIWIELPKDEDL